LLIYLSIGVLVESTIRLVELISEKRINKRKSGEKEKGSKERRAENAAISIKLHVEGNRRTEF